MVKHLSEGAVEIIARVCHEANCAWSKGNGDNSHLPWDEAPEWQKSSARLGVKFHVENPTADASASHDSWLAEKQRDGWKYGPVKNPETKEHPCFLPFNQLPAEQQMKDILFKAIVHTLTI